MSKTKKTTEPVVINMNDIDKAAKKLMDENKAEGISISIKEAKIKDDFCWYKYEQATGKKIGFIYKVDGKGVIDDDMRNAFARLNAHLAFADDVFKHSGTAIEDIDKMHNHELTLLYTCTGFKINGGEENESISLTGTKYLSSGTRMEIEPGRIAIDSLSSYKWYNELKTVADKCREEVALYHYGKFTPVRIEETKEDENQVKMDFTQYDTTEVTEDVNFEEGKV